MDEHWLPLHGYSGKYKISNKGRVFNLAKQREVPSYEVNGRLKVTLYDPDVSSVNLGTLVLRTFTGGRPPESVVVYKDGNKMNACLDNLTWGPNEDKQCLANMREVFGLPVKEIRRMRDAGFGLRAIKDFYQLEMNELLEVLR